MIKTFEQFLNESTGTDWSEMHFKSYSEEEVADVVEETLQSKNLIVFDSGCDECIKLAQHASAEEGEKVLETTGNELTLFTMPVEFIRWDRETAEPSYIIKGEDLNKI